VKNNQPDISLIRKYVNGELDATAMYKLERQAENDPLLMDVIRGMENGEQAEDEGRLVEIDQLINRRIEQRKVQKLTPWKLWAAAASLILISAVTGILVYNKPSGNMHTADLAKTQNNIPAPVVGEQNAKIESGIQYESAPLDRIDTTTVVKAKVPVSVKAPVGARIPSTKTPPFGLNDSSSIAALSSAHQNKATAIEYDPLKEAPVSVGYGAVRNSPVITARMMKKSEDTINRALAGRVAGINTELNEVTVVSASPAKSGKGEPVVGWDKYKLYLEQNAVTNSARAGTVILAFKVDGNGKPIQIRIVKGINDAANQKAEELLVGGSKWTSTEKEITLKIKFRSSFVLP